MKFLVLVCLVASVRAREPITTLNYHETRGIPEAVKIKQAENALDFDGSRIVGGSPSPLAVHPYMVGLVIKMGDGQISVCGASLLNNVRALTAAHCWWDGFSQALSFTLVLGSTRLFYGGKRLSTHEVEMHANYNPFNANNDLAMISFDWVEYTYNIKNIAPLTGTATLLGLWATAVGFGKINDSAAIDDKQALHQATVQIIGNANCQVYFGPWVVVTSTLCTSGAGRAGLCAGDMGGPLVTGTVNNRQLVGVGSFASHRGCQLGLPSGFVRVTSFTAWINARLVV